MIIDLPRVRRVIKAIGNEDFKKTAYRYEVVEFRPDGMIHTTPDLFIDQTQLRADGVKLYEAWDGQGWVLISAAEFYAHKAVWDKLRQDRGYPPVDEYGESA